MSSLRAVAATMLDARARRHAAAGERPRQRALRALLKDEHERGPDFLRLANARSALYPRRP